MTARENILAVLNGLIPERLPFVPCVEGYVLKGLPEELKGMSQLDFLRHIGADVMLRHAPVYQVHVEYTGGVEIHDEVEGGRFTTSFKTPRGEMRCINEFTATSPNIPFPVKRRVETVEDLRALIYLMEHTVTSWAPIFEEYRKVEAEIGEDGLPTVSAACTPGRMMIDHECGAQHFYYLLADHPAEVEAAMALIHEERKQLYERLCASPAQVIIHYENTSTTTTSPRIYERYIAAYLDEYADRCHAAGKKMLIHNCGTLKGVADQIGRGRFDGVIDIAPEPTGDLDLAEAQRLWQGRPIAIGGIDCTAFALWPVGKTREFVRDLLRRLQPGGVMLGSGDAVPFGAKIENLRAVGEEVRRFPS